MLLLCKFDSLLADRKETCITFPLNVWGNESRVCFNEDYILNGNDFACGNGIDHDVVIDVNDKNLPLTTEQMIATSKSAQVPVTEGVGYSNGVTNIL